MWFCDIKDKLAKAKILTRLDRLSLGNFGDCKSLGQGIFELRIHFGPGYRIYFGLLDSEIVLLLLGGTKSSQRRDIYPTQMNFVIDPENTRRWV